MADLKDIFGSQHTLEEEVIILPFRGGTGAGGTYPDGTYSLPAGYSWTDFERVEFYSAESDTTKADVTFASELPREVIQARPTNWEALGGWNDPTVYHYTRYAAINNHQFTVDNQTADIACGFIKAYTRRYATQNVSATVNVNGGANIGTNQRYTIDIATELGSDYVGKDLVVQAEIYNNSGTGTAGWGDPKFIYRDADGGWGVAASTLGDKIVVVTGNMALTHDVDNYCGNPFGGLGGRLTSAPCRVKVWKIDQFLTSTAGSGGGGKTTLFEVSIDSPIYDATVTMNDDISSYDMLMIHTRGDGGWVDTRMLDPEVLLLPANTGAEYFLHTYEPTEYLKANAWTERTFYVDDVGGSAPHLGVFKVIGIKY